MQATGWQGSFRGALTFIVGQEEARDLIFIAEAAGK
jgi:hypothetical protein